MANWDQKGAEAVADNQLSAHNDAIAAFVTSRLDLLQFGFGQRRFLTNTIIDTLII
jgi:hypothetical protein